MTMRFVTLHAILFLVLIMSTPLANTDEFQGAPYFAFRENAASGIQYLEVIHSDGHLKISVTPSLHLHIEVEPDFLLQNDALYDITFHLLDWIHLSAIFSSPFLLSRTSYFENFMMFIGFLKIERLGIVHSESYLSSVLSISESHRIQHLVLNLCPPVIRSGSISSFLHISQIHHGTGHINSLLIQFLVTHTMTSTGKEPGLKRFLFWATPVRNRSLFSVIFQKLLVILSIVSYFKRQELLNIGQEIVNRNKKDSLLRLLMKTFFRPTPEVMVRYCVPEPALHQINSCRGFSKKQNHEGLPLFNASHYIEPLWLFKKEVAGESVSGHLLPMFPGQIRLSVYPVTGFRFLPDTTNNPALDLAHVGYRLATLSALPPSVPVSRVRLADAGFYFRGQGDELVCYSCQVRHSGWTSADNPMDVHRHISPHCPHVTERDRQLSGSGASTRGSQHPTNADNNQQRIVNRIVSGAPVSAESFRQVSDGLTRAQEMETDATAQTTPRENSAQQLQNNRQSSMPVSETQPSEPAALAAPRLPETTASARTTSHLASSSTQSAGYTDSSSRTPTSAARLSTQDGKNQEHHPEQGLQSDSCTTRAGSGPASTDYAASPVGMARQMFPRSGLDLGGAVYPMYQDMASRRRTFPRWDESRAPALDQLVLCGMFYAGYADCVRCFYCGVGLKHWEVSDDVWTEHVRWKPSCGYLLAIKGDDFIRRTLARLGREAGNNEGETEVTVQAAAGDSRTAHAVRSASQAAPPDRPRETVSVTSVPIPDVVSTLQLATPATLTTSLSGTVTSSQAATSLPPSSGLETATTTTAALPPGTRSNHTGARPDGTEGGSRIEAHAGESHSQRVARLQAENRELARRLRCKVCHREPIDTIIMPCGHLVACETCARGITQCPMCHDRIRATAKVHLN